MKTIRIFLLLATLVSTTVATWAAPSANLWEYWSAHDPQSTETVDNSPWARFLARYVVTDHPSGINMVRYGDVTETDEQALRAYVADLAAMSPTTLNRDEQMAYWINLYNALTIQVIVEHYPVRSIRRINISPGLFSSGPWDAKLLTIEGKDVTLNDIEHRILRPIWQDNRVHYAVNCASRGCPNLQTEPYTADNLESLLKKGADEYVNHSRGARFEDERLQASSIYDWFQEDFGGNAAGVVDHLQIYAEGSLARNLEGYSGRIGYSYDWELNEP
jgi:hypothetical protein